MKPDIPTSKERVQHVIKAIDDIQVFVTNHTLVTFTRDNRTYSACLYQFTIIGEATFHINPDILEKYPYPWHRVKSFRNFILHEYFGIEIRAVWHTIQDVLPDLKELMNKMLMDEF